MSAPEPIPQYTKTQIPLKLSQEDANKVSSAPVSLATAPAPKGVRRVRKSVLLGIGALTSAALVVGFIIALNEASAPVKSKQAPAPALGANVPKEGEVNAPEQVTQIKVEDYQNKARVEQGPLPVPGSLEALDAELPGAQGAQPVGASAQALAPGSAAGTGAPPPKGIWEQAAENYQRQQAQNFYQDKVTSRRAGLRVSLEQAPGQGAVGSQSSDEAQLAVMQAELQARRAQQPMEASAYQPGLSVPGMGAGAPSDGISQREKWQTERRAVAGIEPVAALFVGQPGVLRAGTLLEIVLETAIDSELPGMLRARLVRPVEDAQRNVLLPAGTMFLGEYNARVESGSERVQLVWTRAVTPQGLSFLLGAIAGTDRTGASGSSAQVDRHWGELVAGALVSTLLSGGQALAQGNTNALVQTPRQAFAQGVFASGQDTARELSRREVERSVVLRVPAGTHMAAMVHADLLLEVSR